MTCNQTITLLEIYRTGEVDKIACGTTEDDLKRLRSLRWIETLDTHLNLMDRSWNLSELGRKKVEAILNLLE